MLPTNGAGERMARYGAMSRVKFHHFAWGLLAYNLVVILGGAYVRASVSGDGCGAHWPECNGVLIPDGTRLKTVIEFSHRLSVMLLLPLLTVLMVWAYRAFPRRHPVRGGAWACFWLIMAEEGVGAALVKFRLVAHDDSVYRAVAMPTHLIVTFLLLAALALTAWWGSGGRSIQWKRQGALGWLLGVGLVTTLLLGVSGALTALGDTLFPALSHAMGWKQDFAPNAHFLERLRIIHPIIAIASGLYLAVIAAYCMRVRPDARTQSAARMTVMLFITQMLAGAMNFALLAPPVMQLLHLLLADLFWISLVLLTAAALAEGADVAVASGQWSVVSGQGPVESLGTVGVGAERGTWKQYLALTKPRVISLLLFTTLTAMFIAAGGEGTTLPGFWLCVATGLGLYMAAGSANAINMVLERDLDLAMGRTASRPTVTQAIPPAHALVFAAALEVGSFVLLTWAANLLTALLALAGLAFYVIVYTLLLKRRTWYNIVIGGAAGAFPPLVGWAAVTGNLSPLAWCLFGIIFLWTPVHFWALALLIKDDYARAGVPMLPCVRGDRATVSQIVGYALLTVALSALPLLLPGSNGRTVGWIYVGAAVLLNAMLLVRSYRLYQQPDQPHARSLFKYSMVYLALLFLAMAVDRAPWS